MGDLRFVKHRDYKTKEVDAVYLILEEYSEIDYTLLYRKAKYEPFVAAWGYNKEENYWGQGHYFSSLMDAVLYIRDVAYKKGYDWDEGGNKDVEI